MVDADLFISFLAGDSLTPHFRPVVNESLEGALELLASSEVYDGVISALTSQKVLLETLREFIRDMRAIPRRSLPVTLDIAATAVDLYLRYGGSRRLHYFDSFHVARCQLERLSLLTSDKYILANAGRFGIKAIDPRTVC